MDYMFSQTRYISNLSTDYGGSANAYYHTGLGKNIEQFGTCSSLTLETLTLFVKSSLSWVSSQKCSLGHAWCAMYLCRCICLKCLHTHIQSLKGINEQPYGWLVCVKMLVEKLLPLFLRDYNECLLVCSVQCHVFVHIPVLMAVMELLKQIDSTVFTQITTKCGTHEV